MLTIILVRGPRLRIKVRTLFGFGAERIRPDRFAVAWNELPASTRILAQTKKPVRITLPGDSLRLVVKSVVLRSLEFSAQNLYRGV